MANGKQKKIFRKLRLVSRPGRDVAAQACQGSMAELQAELAAVRDALSFGLLRFDAEGNCTHVNQVLETMLGLPSAEILGKRWRRCIYREDRYRLLHEMAGWRNAGQETGKAVCRIWGGDDRPIWVALKAVPIILDGALTGYVGSVEDITARRSGDLALLKSEQRLRMITDNVPALITYVMPDERLAFANRHYENVYGVLHEEACGMHASELLGPDVYNQSKPYIREALSGKPVSFERQIGSGESVRYERVRYIPEFDLQGKVAGYFGLVEDITELKLVEAQLRKLVRFDPLTGLANRIQFEEKLTDAIRHSRRNETLMAIMFLDIDHFKVINDEFGHQAGDEVLCEFAQRLQACVRETDTVARLAGDEFVIILEGLSAPEEAFGVARKIIAAMSVEFVVSGIWRKVTASVGIAVRKSEEENPQALLRQADDAMYRAKAAGRNTFESRI